MPPNDARPFAGLVEADDSRPPTSLRLNDVLWLRAARTPNEPALIDERTPGAAAVTWADLADEARRLAAALAAHGVAHGSRAALLLEDSPSCLATLFAIWHLGAVVVPLDRRWGSQTTSSILGHAAPVCAVGAERVAGVVDTFPFLLFDELARTPVRSPAVAAGDCEDVAMIAYTSGTVAGPKGVVLRHRHFRSAYSIARNALFGAPPKRIGNAFRMAGLGVLGINYLFAVECGAAVVVLPELGIETVRDFWKTVARGRVDFLYLVPTLVQLVARLAEPIEDRREVLAITGGAPLSERAQKDFQDRFGHTLRNVYGLTETTCGVLWGALDSTGRGAFDLGAPPDGIRCRVRDPAGQVNDSISEGELEIAGPFLADGYWMNPQATAEVFVDGWLRTGDLARRDRTGRYTITGRAKNVVIRGGFNICLEEVEQTLLAHGEVLGACGVGVEFAGREEQLAALVQLTPGSTTTAEELARWCRSHLGPAKTPSRIVLAKDALPRNSSGKVLRTEVRRTIERLVVDWK